MRLAPVLLSACVAALSFGLACSSNPASSLGDGAGGFSFGFPSGGSTSYTGGTTGTGNVNSSTGGFTPSSGGSSGGGFSSGGFSGSGGSGGLIVEAGAGGNAPIPDGSAGGGGGQTVYPSPVACPDPRQKKCGGPCIFSSPANGCSVVTCVECPSVANGIQTCDGTACGFACNPGFKPSGSQCVPNPNADGGTVAGTPDGNGCAKNADCTSGVCKSGACTPARCDDHTKNGLETDVDCGGNCAPCEKSQRCSQDSDCDDGPCTSGVCACTPHTCNDPALTGTCGDTLDDHCGGTVQCGCGSGDTCYQGACCDPQAACKAGVCGVVSACGSPIDCGTAICTGKQTCFASQCCTPATKCATGACGSVDDGCGGTIPCGDCTNGRVCSAQKTCACDNTDTDGDGLTDCQEFDDGDDWTDPKIFNGLVGTTYDNCTDGACTSINTNAKVDVCMAKTAVETHDLTAGWGFGNTTAARCDIAYSFTPNWTQSCSDTSFSVAYTGYINLKAGMNCFVIQGQAQSNKQACGVFFLDGQDSESVENGDNAKCFNVTQAGAHAVRIFFDRSQQFLFQPTLGLKWEYCFGGNSNCTPNTVVPQTALRVSN